MRIANVRVLAFALLASGIGAACAGPDRSDLDGGGTTDARMDVRVDAPVDVRVDHYVAPDVRDVAVDVAHDTGRVCIAACTTDLSCQSSCATPASGVWCCDTGTGHCYAYPTMCPSTSPDSGMTMYP